MVGDEKMKDFNLSLRESPISKSPLGLIEISPFDLRNLTNYLDWRFIFWGEVMI